MKNPMQYLGTQTMTSETGDPVVMHLYGVVGGDAPAQQHSVYVMPDLSPSAGLLIDGISETMISR